MRREAEEGDRPGSVVAFAQPAASTGDVPPAGVEQVALNGMAEPGADDPVDVARVVAVVEGEQIEVARSIRWRRPLETVEPRVSDDAAGGDERWADDRHPGLAPGLFAGRAHA